MTTAYTLDRRDRIVEVSDGWDRFALDNGGPGACASHVVGRRLVDAITGDPTRMFMTAILMRVRVSGQPETVPYRCDSDTARRYFNMDLTPLAEDRVRVTHDLDREEPAPISVRIRPAAPGQPARLRCSICCRIAAGAQWVDPFDGSADQSYRVVHTVCPDCKVAPLSGFRRRREA